MLCVSGRVKPNRPWDPLPTRTAPQKRICCSGSLSLCDSNPRTHRGRIGLKAQVLRQLFPPIPILPASVLPQQVDTVLRPPDFQPLDRFIARHRLATEGHIEVDLTAEEPKTALGGDPFLHH